MENKTIEMTGVSVEVAIEKGLEELKCRKEDVEIEVLSKGSVFATASVRLTKKPCETEDIKRFAKVLIDMLGYDVFIELIENDHEIEIKFSGNDISRVIGQKGEMLNAIQSLLSAKYTKAFGKSISVEADTYKEKRIQNLITLANKMASKAKATKRAVVLEPMHSWERKVIHTALSSVEGIDTQSRGQEGRRQVVIIPQGADIYDRHGEVADGDVYTGMYTGGVTKLNTRTIRSKSFGKK